MTNPTQLLTPPAPAATQRRGRHRQHPASVNMLIWCNCIRNGINKEAADTPVRPAKPRLSDQLTQLPAMICPAGGCSGTPRGTHPGLGAGSSSAEPHCPICCSCQGGSPQDHALQRISSPFGSGNSTEFALSPMCSPSRQALHISKERDHRVQAPGSALPGIKAQCPAQEHPDELSPSMGTSLRRSGLGAGVRHLHHLQSPTLLFIVPKQNPSQEQRIFPFAWGLPQVFCLGVLGGQQELSEKQVAHRNAVSIFIYMHRKTNCDFQHQR